MVNLLKSTGVVSNFPISYLSPLSTFQIATFEITWDIF